MLKTRSDLRSEDEIDLVVLVKDLWSQKFVIIAVAMLVAALAYAYAYVSIAEPTYEAKLYILPPTQYGIAGFNAGRSERESGFKPFTVNDVYTAFKWNLEGDSFRQEFFKDLYLPSLSEASRAEPTDQLYKDFSQAIIIGADKVNPARYSVTFQNQDSEKAAKWVKAYVARANEVSKAEMILSVTQEASVRAHDIEKRVERLREVARLAREDRIYQLREALRIAESIGLTSPQEPPSTLLAVEGGGDEALAYRRGSKALKAEIDVLLGRASDDAFISDLRKLQSRHDYLNTLTIDPGSVSVSRQDGNIEASTDPIKTKKKFIVLAGILAGLILGVLIALIRIFFLRPIVVQELMVREGERGPV